MQWTWKNKWTLLGFYVRVGEAKRSEAVSLVKLVPRAQFWWKSFYYCLSTQSGTSQGLISSVCLQLWTMLPERKKEEVVFVGIRYSKGGQFLNTATLHPFTSCEEVAGMGEEKWMSLLWLEAFPPGSLWLLCDCFLTYDIITQSLTSIKGNRRRKSKLSFHAHKFGLDLFFVFVCAYIHWIINAHKWGQEVLPWCRVCHELNLGYTSLLL